MIIFLIVYISNYRKIVPMILQIVFPNIYSLIFHITFDTDVKWKYICLRRIKKRLKSNCSLILKGVNNIKNKIHKNKH